jgi:transcriptional regulator with XRE-family HTH domain
MKPDKQATAAMDPALCRAARILARVDIAALADESGMDVGAIERFEEGMITLSETDAMRLRRALEGLGVIFIPDNGDGGVGVRLRFSAADSRSISRWEAEGGSAAEDDIP